MQFMEPLVEMQYSRLTVPGFKIQARLCFSRNPNFEFLAHGGFREVSTGYYALAAASFVECLKCADYLDTGLTY